MTKDEALKMAIEMLEKLSYEYGRLLDGDQDYGLLPSEINADIIKTYYVKRTCQEALEKQEWKRLNNDMVRAIGEKCQEENRGVLNWIDFYNAIESMLKDKNYDN